jgi:hypothetical protein
VQKKNVMRESEHANHPPTHTTEKARKAFHIDVFAYDALPPDCKRKVASGAGRAVGSPWDIFLEKFGGPWKSYW